MTKSIFCNAYPWLFPGGIGDLYDMKRGEWSVREWGRHLLRYFDGRFLQDQLFCLFVFNTMERHTNNTQGSFFFNNDKFIGKNPPTVEELKDRLRNNDDTYIQMLRYFSRNIKGSDNYWRSKTEELEQWIAHHISRGRGPPTFFITFSCAENWWPDLRRLLGQLEEKAGNIVSANAIKNNSFPEMREAAKKYPLFVNDFFMKRSKEFLNTVVKEALGIEHYWGRIEFAPGRGQIHLHLLAIAKDRAYLDDFYRAKTWEEKASVINYYAKTRLDMTADVNIKDDDPNYHPSHPQSPLSRKFCEVTDEKKDLELLCQDCMCHHCNKFCLRESKKGHPRTCRVGFGDEKQYLHQNTPGMNHRNKPEIVTDMKGITRFHMKRTKSKRVVQHSRTLLKGWRANCDIKLLLYFSNPNFPDVGEIEEVSKYVVAYTGKRNHTSREEKESIQNLITWYVTKYPEIFLSMKYFPNRKSHNPHNSAQPGNIFNPQKLHRPFTPHLPTSKVQTMLISEVYVRSHKEHCTV